MNAALARRLERAEAAANVAFIEARARLQPELGATWLEVAGAYALYDGVGSPLTQTFGVGVFEPFGEPEYDRVERFFGERGSPTHHEVCALADAQTRSLLQKRGYQPIEESVVLTRPTAGMAESELQIRQVGASDAALWARIAGHGWSSESLLLAEFVEQIGLVMAMSQGVHCFLAELDGQPIAAAALNLQTDVALLAGASTIPSARRRGAQQALLQARLAFAAQQGVDLAMVVTQPDSASMRNAQRQGFTPVYARTKWALP